MIYLDPLPRATRMEMEDGAPYCPHCHGEMHNATVHLHDLIAVLDAQALDEEQPADRNGCAKLHTLLTQCPDCGLSSVVTIDKVPGMARFTILTPVRTPVEAKRIADGKFIAGGVREQA